MTLANFDADAMAEVLADAFFDDPSGTDMSKLFATRLELTC